MWQSDVAGKNTSEALFDPYSFAHGFAGCLQFYLIPPPGVWGLEYAFALNLFLHALFEVVENTPVVIRICRTTTIDKEYRGDTVVNSSGDLVSFMFSYIATFALWTTVGWYSLAYPVLLWAILSCFYCRGTT